MSTVLQPTTIDLLETELVRARDALHEIRPIASPIVLMGEEITVGAMAAYRQSLMQQSPEFYGARQLTPKDLGLVTVVREVQPDFPGNEQLLGLESVCTVTAVPSRRATLVDVLSNNLILDRMAPYLSVASLLKLASTSRYLRSVILETPYVFRHLDLTRCRGARLPNTSSVHSGGLRWSMNRSSDEDICAQPLRNIFTDLGRRSILQDVRTLILDGLSVPASLVAEIILSNRFNVSILSIRECLNLDEHKLMQVLQLAVRPDRPKGTPRVKGIYHFSPINVVCGTTRTRYRDWWDSRVSASRCAGRVSISKSQPREESRENFFDLPQNQWYRPTGKVFKRSIEDGWAETIQKCEGIIAFDAVLCRGPRHDAERYASMTDEDFRAGEGGHLLPPAIATIALGPKGCDQCHSSPEGPAIRGQSPDEQFPLLNPPPMHSSTIAAAKLPTLSVSEHPVLVARCADCLTDRWCQRCNKWFCSVCLPRPERNTVNLTAHQTVVKMPPEARVGRTAPSGDGKNLKPGVSKTCWYCGPTCASCKFECQRTCDGCDCDYCTEHNSGCSSSMIILPQSALEQLLQAAPLREVSRSRPQAYTRGFDPFNPHTFAAEATARNQQSDRQQQLPHPLTFRIVNPRNDRVVYAGIREFSAEENEIGLSPFLRDALGIEDEIMDSDMPIVTGTTTRSSLDVTVHAKQLPKGTFVRLRPLEAGYDPEDWKALLERHLRENFTTLTRGEVLSIPGNRNESFKFLVDKLNPDGDGICVVDTDLEVDIEALTEEQARETLKRHIESSTRRQGLKGQSSVGGRITPGENVVGQVTPGEYVDYELEKWTEGTVISVICEAIEGNEGDIDLFVSPFSSRQRNRPRIDEHVFGAISSNSPKQIRLEPTNIELEEAEALYISVHAFLGPETTPSASLRYNLRVVTSSPDVQHDAEDEQTSHGPDDVQCKNCRQWVPQRALVLHENFCFRNNVHCPMCDNVFQKRSPEWENHWHCPHDDFYGSDLASKNKHDTIFHKSYQCPNCEFDGQGLPSLARHRTTTCRGKIILCQFCHLAVPQKGELDPDMHDPEVLLSGLTPHELVDGGRTTECHLCSKIIRLREMKTHLRHHNLERISRPPPRVCVNQNCARTVTSPSNDSLGLCSICFGPLYVDTYDPERKALRRRIERRYLSQMMAGCGKPWCQNEYCKTGNQNRKSTKQPAETMSAADILARTRPLLEAITFQQDDGNTMPNNTAPFYLCTDQASQQRRILAETIASESEVAGPKAYSVEWCIAAVEAGSGDLDRARDWLANWAPAKGETMQS
ncbi:hypothetical protein ASPZODRAFT_159302 [Penicilliopsis zonata CBS 506.65]|uniref:Uncharacterized protein n=1 Tax=Penicilliopsis zonata CBS 506.65 TaxID=1073090 RepID=A0A1L9SGW0_9EURO|nr:hypothetical protein ASPZODRAFT_159302 [Penicilliopsis zonata CBS 506.65]OJJ46346.1 hypothetical protein ASPZODRAFT_159302 [Penicilliopsis zonata CBS 506.65]